MSKYKAIRNRVHSKYGVFFVFCFFFPDPTDTTPPVISDCPDAVTVCYATGSTVTKGSWTEPTVSDDVQVKSFTSDVSQENFLEIPQTSPYTSTVTYTAEDWAGNTATCQFDLVFNGKDWRYLLQI